MTIMPMLVTMNGRFRSATHAAIRRRIPLAALSVSKSCRAECKLIDASLTSVVVATRLPSIVEACCLPFTTSMTFHRSTELTHEEAIHQPKWNPNFCWVKRAKEPWGQRNQFRHAALRTHINASEARRISGIVEIPFVSKVQFGQNEPKKRLDDAYKVSANFGPATLR